MKIFSITLLFLALPLVGVGWASENIPVDDKGLPKSSNTVDSDTLDSPITDNSVSEPYNSSLPRKQYIQYNTASLLVLNKTTGIATHVLAKIDKIINFDKRMSFIIHACYKTSQKYEPESFMFIQVASTQYFSPYSEQINNKLLLQANKHLNKPLELSFGPDNILVTSNIIFSGWMFSNNPEISALEDINYDISVIKCFNS